MLYRYTKEKIMRERRMPVLQWGMLCVLSLLLSIGFLAVHLPAALLLGPMIAGIIFSMRGITLQLPRSAFLAAQAILGCMIAQNLTGSILTTLAVNWPIVLAILLVTLLSSAIVGWLLVRYSSLPGNTGAWGSDRKSTRLNSSHVSISYA